MYLRNNIFKLILLIIYKISFNSVIAKDINAYEVYKICSDYYQWVNKNYSLPVDEKMLFNMGKCQGVLETMGKTMLTLCYENKRNMNINKRMTANLKGVKTIEIVKRFVKTASLDGSIRNFSAQIYLINFINKNWPCN